MNFCAKHYRLIKKNESECEVCRLCPTIYYFDEENPGVQCVLPPGHKDRHTGGVRCGTITWSDTDMTTRTN